MPVELNHTIVHAKDKATARSSWSFSPERKRKPPPSLSAPSDS